MATIKNSFYLNRTCSPIVLCLMVMQDIRTRVLRPFVLNLLTGKIQMKLVVLPISYFSSTLLFRCFSGWVKVGDRGLWMIRKSL